MPYFSVCTVLLSTTVGQMYASLKIVVRYNHSAGLKLLKNKVPSSAGFEPATSGLEVQRAIPCATRTCNIYQQFKYLYSRESTTLQNKLNLAPKRKCKRKNKKSRLALVRRLFLFSLLDTGCLCKMNCAFHGVAYHVSYVYWSIVENSLITLLLRLFCTQKKWVKITGENVFRPFT